MIASFLLLWVFAGAVSGLGGEIPAVRYDGDPAMVIESADGSTIAERGTRREGTVTLGDVPDHLLKAILAVEDRGFYGHWGVDLKGVARAAWYNLLAKKVVQGGSTVSQQTARLLFLSQDRSFSRKASELLTAFWLESRLSKEEILERYLNNVYFGAGATGIADAAKVFFNKPPSALTLSESALLAELIHAPTRLNPLQHPEAARGRAGVVLDSMVEAGFIGEPEAAVARAAPPQFALAESGSGEGAWFADWVHTEALKSIRDEPARVRGERRFSRASRIWPSA